MITFRHPDRRWRIPIALCLSILLLAVGTLLALPAKAQEGFEPSRFSVEVYGEGPDVIFIPGLSTSREVWRDHATALEGYRVHLLQIRGFGDEAGVNAEGPILDALIAELARYIEANAIEKPAIIGHSMGGFVAMSLGARHPQLPGRILIVDSLPWFAAITVAPGTEPDRALVESQAEMMRMMLLSSHGQDRPENANDAVLLSYTADPANLQRLRDLTSDADPRVTGQLAYELLLGDMREGVAGITAPVSVIVPHRPGFMTEAALVDFYRQQYAALPSARFVPISPAAHFVMVDQPDAFDAALRAFLAE